MTIRRKMTPDVQKQGRNDGKKVGFRHACALCKSQFDGLPTRVGRVAQSVQRLATGWTVRAANPGGSEVSRTCPDRPWGPPSLLYNGYRVFHGGKERPGRDADPSPPSSAVVMKGYSYTSTLSMGRTACTEPQCLYKGDLYLYLLTICVMLNCPHICPYPHNSYDSLYCHKISVSLLLLRARECSVFRVPLLTHDPVVPY